jgi:hypothetical protein
MKLRQELELELEQKTPLKNFRLLFFLKEESKE